MADQKISALSAATIPLAGTEVVPIVQSGTTKKVAVNQLANNTTPGAGNFTTVDANGIITSTRTSGQVVKAESGGTGILYSNFANTGGNFFYGIDNSTGTALFTGSSAYAAFVGSVANTDFYLLSNNTPVVKLSGGNAILPGGNLSLGTSGKGVSFNDFGGTRTFGWGNVSSIAQDLATLFDNVSFTNRGLSIEVQVMTQSTTSAATSATFVGLRTGGGTWAFTAVNAATSGGPTITPSGSGTTLTLSFSAGGQFGVALVRLISQS